MAGIAALSRGESRRQQRPPYSLLSSFSLLRKLKLSRRCLRVACAAAALGVTLAGWTAIDAAECEGWNTEWLWTSASSVDIQACLDVGADPNARDSKGRTPLRLGRVESGPAQNVAASG